MEKPFKTKAVGEFQDGVLLALVNQAVVDLIGDDVGRALGNCPHGPLGEQAAGWIGRRVDEDGLCPPGDLLPDRLRPEFKAVFFVYRYLYWNASKKFYEIGIAGIARIGEDNLLARFQQRCKDQHHGWRCAGGHGHLLRLHRNAIFIKVVPANGLSKLLVPQAVRVMCEPLLQRPAGGIFHSGRNIEVRLANFQVDDIDSPALHLPRPFHDFHDDKGGNIFGSSGDHPAPPLIIVLRSRGLFIINLTETAA